MSSRGSPIRAGEKEGEERREGRLFVERDDTFGR